MTRAGDWMQTFTGKRFYLLDPDPADVDPVDIAHALSLLCRFNGHVDRFYSVAEHCVLLSQVVEEEHALWALLHDATEAYVGDMIRPLKRSMPAYKIAENRVMDAICDRFGIPHAEPAQVREVDTRILTNEKAALLSRSEVWSTDALEPLPVTVGGWTPRTAELNYLERLGALLPDGELHEYVEQAWWRRLSDATAAGSAW